MGVAPGGGARTVLSLSGSHAAPSGGADLAVIDFDVDPDHAILPPVAGVIRKDLMPSGERGGCGPPGDAISPPDRSVGRCVRSVMWVSLLLDRRRSHSAFTSCLRASAGPGDPHGADHSPSWSILFRFRRAARRSWRYTRASGVAGSRWTPLPTSPLSGGRSMDGQGGGSGWGSRRERTLRRSSRRRGRGRPRARSGFACPRTTGARQPLNSSAANDSSRAAMPCSASAARTRRRVRGKCSPSLSGTRPATSSAVPAASASRR